MCMVEDLRFYNNILDSQSALKCYLYAWTCDDAYDQLITTDVNSSQWKFTVFTYSRLYTVAVVRTIDSVTARAAELLRDYVMVTTV